MLFVGKIYEKACCVPTGTAPTGGPLGGITGGVMCGGCCFCLAAPVVGGVAAYGCAQFGGAIGAVGGCSAGKNLVTVQAGHVGVVLRFGKFHKVLPPGRHRINIMADAMTEVATRV